MYVCALDKMNHTATVGFFLILFCSLFNLCLARKIPVPEQPGTDEVEDKFQSVHRPNARQTHVNRVKMTVVRRHNKVLHLPLSLVLSLSLYLTASAA